ncbi:MAG: NADPH-dependent FMN reductase [Bacteroidota bacterium]
MKILTISGSTRPESANVRLLATLPGLFPEHTFTFYAQLSYLPIFKAEIDKYPWHAEIVNWRTAVRTADAIIFSTPEYIHNMPALLKNALEWLTSSGELAQKRVLAMTFSPRKPRGEKAMQSLLWSLQALDANVVVQLPLYQDEINFTKRGQLIENESSEMLKAAIHLLMDVF